MRPATSKWNRQCVNLVLTTFLLLSSASLSFTLVRSPSNCLVSYNEKRSCLRTGFCCCYIFFFFFHPVLTYSSVTVFLYCECVLTCFSHVQLFATLWDCSPPGCSVHEILQARVLEWVTISLLPGIFLEIEPRDRAQVSYVSCTAGRFFTSWAVMEETSWF